MRTARLAIRNWQTEDLDEFFDIYSRWEVMKWLGSHPRRTVADRGRQKADCTG
jgi:RimJ/RimL family protein N-acetyltransferase